MLAKVVQGMSKNCPVLSNSRKDAPNGTRRISAAANELIVKDPSAGGVSRKTTSYRASIPSSSTKRPKASHSAQDRSPIRQTGI